MKINGLYLVIMVLFLLPLSQTAEAQNAQDRQVDSFEGVKVSQGIDVELVKGDGRKVRVEVDDIALDRVVTEVDDHVLKIYLEHGNYRNSDVRVIVYYNTLTMIAANSAGDVYARDMVKGENLSIMVSSAASVELKLEVNELKIDASSAGDIEVSGSAKRLSVEVSSAGDVDADDLRADEVYVRASSAGDSRVYAVKSIDARASTGANIRFRGNPEHSETGSSSGGSVRKLN